jgi:hypothetical protein
MHKSDGNWAASLGLPPVSCGRPLNPALSWSTGRRWGRSAVRKLVRRRDKRSCRGRRCGKPLGGSRTRARREPGWGNWLTRAGVRFQANARSAMNHSRARAIGEATRLQIVIVLPLPLAYLRRGCRHTDARRVPDGELPPVIAVNEHVCEATPISCSLRIGFLYRHTSGDDRGAAVEPNCKPHPRHSLRLTSYRMLPRLDLDHASLSNRRRQ